MLLIDNKTPSGIITRYTIMEASSNRKSEQRNVIPQRSLRVLLAEDNLVNQKVATKILQKMDCTVDIAANGIEAVSMVKQFPYDLIFMDCQMPEMDGYEATRLIKKFLELESVDADIPVIAMTANAIKGDRENCLAAGMDDYISKPIDQKKLNEIIAEWTNIKITTKKAI